MGEANMTNSAQQDSQTSRDLIGEGLPVPPQSVREPLPTPDVSSELTGKEKENVPASSGTQSDIGSRTEFADSVHDYVREYIRLADQKATFFFAGATALLAFLYNKGISARWLKPVMTWNILDTVAFIAMIALAIGAFLSLVVVIPKTRGSKRGFFFWEAVAEYDNGRSYADDISTLSPATLFQAKAEHCFDLSRVCRTKYGMLRLALWFCAVGLGAAMIVFLFL
jgi:hypothetical protein